MGFAVILAHVADEYAVGFQVFTHVGDVLRYDVEDYQLRFGGLAGWPGVGAGRVADGLGFLGQLVQVGVQAGVRGRFFSNGRKADLFLVVAGLGEDALGSRPRRFLGNHGGGLARLIGGEQYAGSQCQGRQNNDRGQCEPAFAGG